MSDFKPGEIVDVVIKGVRILADHDAYVVITDEHGIDHAMPSQAAVTHATPAEWPPQVGDLWRDKDGDLWFVVLDEGEEWYEVMLRGTLDSLQATDLVHREYGPLALVHREQGEATT